MTTVFAPPCATSPDLFFAEDPASISEAKTICFTCPIRTTCLQDASTTQPETGVWGGELFAGGTVVACALRDCSACGRTKSLTEFNRDRRRPDGRGRRCKDCKRAYDVGRPDRKVAAPREVAA